MSRKTNFSKTLLQSQFYCTKCGKQGIDVFRKKSRIREPGHLKKLYCVTCKKENNHVEIRPNIYNYTYNDFLLEMKYNNFDEEGKRKIPFKQLKKQIKEGVYNG